VLDQPVETRQNPLGPVETRYNPLEHVRTCWDMLEHVQTCWNTFPGLPPSPSIPPPPPTPPPFPLSFGGGRGGGREGEGGGVKGGITITSPPGGGGGRSPPPLRILQKLFSISLSSSNLQNLCYLPTLEVSLSPLLLKTTKTYEKCWPLKKNFIVAYFKNKI
jgi:hypothetical protein